MRKKKPFFINAEKVLGTYRGWDRIKRSPMALKAWDLDENGKEGGRKKKKITVPPSLALSSKQGHRQAQFRNKEKDKQTT